MYNVVNDLFFTTCVSGISPGLVVPLSTIDSRLLFPITLASGSYIGLEFQSQTELQCSEISLNTSFSTTSLKVDYARFTSDIYSSNGIYNNNTGYCKPKMIYYDEPAGYAARASSEVPGYYSYKAFSQSNLTEMDCWQSANITQMSGTAPQCLVFTFSGTGKVINRYQILSRNHASINYRAFPRSWSLQGANDSRATAYDDIYWATLDTQVGVGDPGQNTWSTIFNFDNGNRFSKYRLRIIEHNGSSSWYFTCIGELKLIEADQIYSYPTFSWYPGNWISSSTNRPSVSFGSPQGMDQIRLFLGNTSNGPITISGINIMVRGTDEITMAGASETLRYTFVDDGPLLLDIKNDFSGRAFPRVALDYTGDYEVDRNVFISTDYATEASGDKATWVGLDSGGLMIPEHYPWDLGTLSGTLVYRKQLQLTSTSLSGNWVSPVFNTNTDSLRAYVYAQGSNYPRIELRSSNTEPANAIFSVVTTENTNEKLMYQHKRIVLDSNGYVVSRVECSSPQTGNKIWRMADYTFAGQPLSYYGSVNSRGTAAFLAPGYTSCVDVDPVQESLDATKWYNLCMCKLDDTSLWNLGVSVSGFEWGPTKNVLFTKTFPVGNSDAFFFAAISTSTPQEEDVDIRTRVNMGFYSSGRTLMSFPIITLYGSRLTASDHYDVVPDYANNGWWVYLGGTIGKLYKTDVGSFNTVHAFGMGDLYSKHPESHDLYFGYLYETDFDSDYKHIVGIPNTEFSGFWAFTSSGICLFREDYEFEVPTFDNVRQIYQSTITNNSFTELHQGCCDSFGNLWVVDIAQEQLFRVNLKRTLNANDLNPIDSDQHISGIINVSPHPTNETAYALCSASLMNPDQDTIRMVSAGQDPNADSQFVCAVPGFLSAPFKRCVDFSSTTYDTSYRVRGADRIWGTGAAGWYSVGNNSKVPRGQFSQIRLTLSRNNLSQAAPSVQHVRLPGPITLEPLDYLQSRQIAVKTVFNRAKTFGIFNTKLLVWWFDEEFYYG